MMLPLAKPTARQPRKWSVLEDQKLREEVEAQRSEGEVKDWCRVAAKLPGRTNKDCRKRWLNSVAGGLKKGQWSRSEDMQLARGVDRFGQRWTLVAEVVSSRSADQCAKRWQQSLDPELDRSEWQEAEDQILIEAVQRLGRHWKDIQRHHFPGRSKNCIKNRYTVIIRRYQNSGIPLPEGRAGSETSTPSNRLSVATDDDNLSYPEGLYDDLLTTQTQISTPETRHSWPLDEEPFPSWSSQESFNIAAAQSQPDFAKLAQQPHAHITAPAQWSWTTTSMEAPPAMNLMSTAAYSPGFTTHAPPYDPYGAMQGMVLPPQLPVGAAGAGASFHASAPTSSPAASLQDRDAMNSLLRYGMLNQPGYPF